MSSPLSLGFSPCPNDTFIFYALVHGKIDVDGVQFAHPCLADVEQLNEWALAGHMDISKMSFHAFGHVQNQYRILAAGSALGRGCGPLLIARSDIRMADLSKLRIAIPGKLTTAALLLQLFLPDCREPVAMRFDEIIKAVADGTVDAGVIIHESRFTYHKEGLICLEDLGRWWEDNSGMPLPLGCIAAKKTLGQEKISAVDRAIRASIDYAFLHPEECFPYIRSHSQEMDEQVVGNHIGLYVNDFTRDLGNEGRAAIDKFLEMGRMTGALPPSENGKKGLLP